MYQGRTLTIWDSIQEYFYFLSIPVGMIIVGIILIIWLMKK